MSDDQKNTIIASFILIWGSVEFLLWAAITLLCVIVFSFTADPMLLSIALLVFVANIIWLIVLIRAQKKETDKKPFVSLIVAMAENNCIGQDNKMPWHISEDLKRFKSLTMGHPVIMGRKTFESILGYLKKPLPGRDSIIVSRSGYNTPHENITICDSLENAIEAGISLAKKNNLEEVFIIGGAQIYTQSLKHADRIHLTKVHQTVEGDAFFPIFDEKEWIEIGRTDYMEHSPPYSFITLERP